LTGATMALIAMLTNQIMQKSIQARLGGQSMDML